jgi:hypothetical protein
MSVTPQEFKAAFQAAFLVNRKHLLWDTKNRRTAHMIAYIYRTIADSFPGLDIEYEHAGMDAVLYHETLSNIEVAIEHENNVTTIATEISNFAQQAAPLSVLVTYTGNRGMYLLLRHSVTTDALRGQLLLILNPEDKWPDSYRRGDVVPWDFYLYSSGRLDLI